MSTGSSERAIRVLIIEDHDLFRTGLAAFLEEQPDIEVVAQASTGRMGVRLAAELAPEIVVMDLHLPDLDGFEAIPEILAARPDTRVVTLTAATDDIDIAAALRAGACAYLVKDSPIDDVTAAIRAASTGSAWLSPRAADAVLNRLRTDPSGVHEDPATSGELSAREIDVLRLLSRGMENTEIAEALDISPSTVKNHVSSILGKLGLSNRIQAAVYAVRNELN